MASGRAILHQLTLLAKPNDHRRQSENTGQRKLKYIQF
jgi:hypothetical protein